MESVYLVIGVALLVSTLVDVLWTTLWPDGAAGPLSSALSTMIWRIMRRVGRSWDRAKSLAGPVVLAATLLMWITLLWAGWVLLFASDEGSLIPSGDIDVTWTGRIYFVAYSMFTMGNGDFAPATGAWQIATSLTTATGMVIVTLGVTYLLSVVSAVAEKRGFAASVTGLGRRPEDIVITAWNGRHLHSLDLALNSLSSQLAVLADQHKAFPVLHYFHAAERSDASAVAVAVLDEALTIIDAGIPDVDRNAVTFQRRQLPVDRAVGLLPRGREAAARPRPGAAAISGPPDGGRPGVPRTDRRVRRATACIAERGAGRRVGLVVMRRSRECRTGSPPDGSCSV